MLCQEHTIGERARLYAESKLCYFILEVLEYLYKVLDNLILLEQQKVF